MLLIFLIWRRTAKFWAALLGQKSLEYDDPIRGKINEVSSSGNFMELEWTQRLVSLAKTVVILWGTYVWVKYTHRSPGLLTRTRTRLEVDAARKKWPRSCARVFCPLLWRSLFETSLSYLMHIYVRCSCPTWCLGLSLPCAVRDMRCCAGRHVELINYGELINHVELIAQQFVHRDFTTALAFLTFTTKWRPGSRCLRPLAVFLLFLFSFLCKYNEFSRYF